MDNFKELHPAVQVAEILVVGFIICFVLYGIYKIAKDL
jgi:hypothetical protein